MERKIKVLALCDTPTSATGFAQLSRNVLTGLAKTGKYHIDVVGINYYGDFYDREKFPYNIYPAMPQGHQDMYGRGRFMQAIGGAEHDNGLKAPWDIVFTIQDPFIIEGLGAGFPFGEQMKVTREMWRRSLPPETWYSWIAYFPVDSDLKENWVTRSIALADVPVMYCEWGKKQALKWDRKDLYLTFNLKETQDADNRRKARMLISPLEEKISVIHHGVSLTDFHPISDKERAKFREEYFSGSVKPDTYLVVNISRNQPRKDISRTMQAFALFKKRHPKALLYLHCKVDDVGGSILEMARNFNLALGDDFMVPEDFKANTGYPVDIVNKIYNAADLCVTTTLGEGWGFITTEAMATKTPIIAPNITSMLDIFDSYDYQGSLLELHTSAKLRGIPVKSGSTTSEWTCLGQTDNERVRPLTNVDDMVEKMIWAANHPKDVQIIVERAYKWVQGLAWEKIVAQWDEVFMRTYAKLEEERAIARKLETTGRNEVCPCGSGKKFKHCHGGPLSLDKFADWLGGPQNG